MYLIDTHTHIFLEEFDCDRKETLERAENCGVKFFCLPNIDLDSVERLHALCDSLPAKCFPMMGLHPTSVSAGFKNSLNEIRNKFAYRKYIAVGEIGIDLYWDKTYAKEQIQAFETQLGWSMELNLPVVVHTRDAFPEVFESIAKIGADKLRGIFHSFGGTYQELETALGFSNFLLGINGTLTFKNSRLKDYLSLAPIERIVLETDAPYLAPVPNRGKRNEPSFILYTATKLAEIYNIPLEVIARQTSLNAEKLFGL